MTKQYRVKCYKLRSIWWRIQERNQISDKWRDSFIAPWSGSDGKSKAEIYLRKIQADEKAARP